MHAYMYVCYMYTNEHIEKLKFYKRRQWHPTPVLLPEKSHGQRSVLAWRIPGTGEPGGLPSMGSQRVRDDWSDLAVAVAAVRFKSCLKVLSKLQTIRKHDNWCQGWWKMSAESAEKHCSGESTTPVMRDHSVPFKKQFSQQSLRRKRPLASWGQGNKAIKMELK